jgi:hypothetical protein
MGLKRYFEYVGDVDANIRPALYLRLLAMALPTA